MSRRRPVEVYTDGNPNAYGIVMLYGENTKKIKSDYYSQSSVDRMELKGIIHALEVLEPGYDIYIYSDSKGSIDIINGALSKWIEDGSFIDRTNNGLWRRFLIAKKKHLNGGSNMYFNWIRGHSGNKYNEMADSLANEARHQAKQKRKCKTDN